jgi:hypothetical protein
VAQAKARQAQQQQQKQLVQQQQDAEASATPANASVIATGALKTFQPPRRTSDAAALLLAAHATPAAVSKPAARVKVPIYDPTATAAPSVSAAAAMSFEDADEIDEPAPAPAAVVRSHFFATKLKPKPQPTLHSVLAVPVANTAAASSSAPADNALSDQLEAVREYENDLPPGDPASSGVADPAGAETSLADDALLLEAALATPVQQVATAVQRRERALVLQREKQLQLQQQQHMLAKGDVDADDDWTGPGGAGLDDTIASDSTVTASGSRTEAPYCYSEGAVLESGDHHQQQQQEYGEFNGVGGESDIGAGACVCSK